MECGSYGGERAVALVDLGKIGKNFDALSSKVGASVKKMAVVKADAYGHGAVAVARFLASRADFFGVATVDEGVELRQGGILTPILVLSPVAEEMVKRALSHGLSLTVADKEGGAGISRCASEMKLRASVHFAVDTGMGRIGFPPSDVGVEDLASVAELPWIFAEGIFSHFATADMKDKTYSLMQGRKFEDFCRKLSERGVCPKFRHISNSAASMELNYPFDMCRFGIAMYGLYPSDQVDKSKIVLHPAMEVKARISFLKTASAGDKIGYGGLYQAPKSRKIATVSIGYADGFSRCLTERGEVLFRGARYPIVGKVCMDQVMVDMTDAKEAAVGDYVTVLGRDGEEFISAEELAAASSSFNYETVCRFTHRVKRIYTRY